jgi:uncharacterized protein (UPF0332 family)
MDWLLGVVCVNVDECVEKGLLKRAEPDREKARESIKTAERKHGLAERELKARIFENAVISAYTAMFHAARALLYKDGFKERSHYALCVFVAEKYGGKLEKRFVHALEALRLERHELTYGINAVPEVRKTEAHDAVEVAREFVAAVKKLV